MLRIIIKNQSGVETNRAEFLTQAEIDSWLVENNFSFPENFTQEIIDISEEIEKRTYFIRKDRNESFGKKMLRELQFINHKKLSLGQLTIQDALNTKQNLEQIQGHLFDGDIELARGLIDLYPTDKVITSEVKQSFLNMIDQYLGG